MNSPCVRRLRLGKEIRALRTGRNMTQARMARLAGMTRNNASNSAVLLTKAADMLSIANSNKPA
jgi:DNA-binding transcriptional regulator YiaG